jgi:hypothetical protein
MKHHVEAIRQPNWSACWHTAMLMLDRWRRVRMGWNQISPASLETVVYQPAKIAQQSVNLFNRANIGNFLLEHGFTSRTIKTTPEAFSQVILSKPFGYVAQATNNYQHTLVITGIERNQKGLYTIYYNDPDGGRALQSEFYAFMSKHIPAWGNDAFVVIP